jgi:hypothetical protein
MYWTTRGVQEFEKMFGRKPFTTPQFDGLAEGRAVELLREEMRKATIHFGEGRMNPSTMASIFALIEERVTGRLPTRAPLSSVGRDLLEGKGLAKPRHEPEPV